MTEPRYQIALCPHCGEELSVWPVAPDLETVANRLHDMNLGCVSRWGLDESARKAYDKPKHLADARRLRAGEG